MFRWDCPLHGRPDFRLASSDLRRQIDEPVLLKHRVIGLYNPCFTDRNPSVILDILGGRVKSDTRRTMVWVRASGVAGIGLTRCWSYPNGRDQQIEMTRWPNLTGGMTAFGMIDHPYLQFFQPIELINDVPFDHPTGQARIS
jgi:hypothetical protein